MASYGSEFKFNYPFNNLIIVDGDTVHANLNLGIGAFRQEKIRLLGFDAPETWRPKNEEERLKGQEAKEYLSKLMKNALFFEVTSHPTKYRDAYGRLLADVILSDGSRVSEHMRRQGY